MPGGLNKTLLFIQRFLPRTWVAGVSRRLTIAMQMLGVQDEFNITSTVESAAEMFSSAGAEVAEVVYSSTGAVLSNVFDINGVRMELAELPPESDHYKAMDSWGQ